MGIVFSPGCAPCTSPFLTLWYILAVIFQPGFTDIQQQLPLLSREKKSLRSEGKKNNRQKKNIWCFSNVLHMGANRKKSLTTLSAGEFPESLNKYFYNTQAVNNVWLWPARATPERENNFLNTWVFFHQIFTIVFGLWFVLFCCPPSRPRVVPLWSW